MSSFAPAPGDATSPPLHTPDTRVRRCNAKTLQSVDAFQRHLPGPQRRAERDGPGRLHELARRWRDVASHSRRAVRLAWPPDRVPRKDGAKWGGCLARPTPARPPVARPPVARRGGMPSVLLSDYFFFFLRLRGEMFLMTWPEIPFATCLFYYLGYFLSFVFYVFMLASF